MEIKMVLQKEEKKEKKWVFFEISDTLMLLLVCGQETRP